MGIAKDFLLLNNQKFQTLKNGGIIEKDGEQFQYDQDSIYAVETNVVDDVVDSNGESLVDENGVAHCVSIEDVQSMISERISEAIDQINSIYLG